MQCHTYNQIIVCVVVYTLYLKQVCVAKPPNVVLIVADDYGYNDVGYHGSEIHTPNLDKLAGQGVRLENYYVQPICTPTRSQLMSGRYQAIMLLPWLYHRFECDPQLYMYGGTVIALTSTRAKKSVDRIAKQLGLGLQHSIIWPPQPSCLPLEDKTIADALKGAGYATHMVGKWHLGQFKKACFPTHRGFDSYFGFLTGSGDYFKHRHVGCGITMNPACSYWTGWDLRENEAPVHDYDGIYSTHLFTQKAQKIIETHDKTKPLFLYQSYQAVHGPLQVPDEYLVPYQNVTDRYRRLYSGMVTCMDEGIGNLTQSLQKTGLWDDTVVIFSTDNGGEIYAGGNNWPLRGWKHSLWEGGIHGVGFVTGPAFPGKLRGMTYKGLMHVSDWFPTIVGGIAGATLNETKLDGINMWESISTGAPSPRTEILHNIDSLEVTPVPCKQPVMASDSKTFNTSIRAAIRVGDWKLITGDPGNSTWFPVPNSGTVAPNNTDPSDKHLWLFNIADDPREYNDLSEYYPDVVARLFDRLQEHYTDSVEPFYPPGDPKADPARHNDTWSDWEI